MLLLREIRLHLLATQRSSKRLLRGVAMLLCLAIILPLLSGCQVKEEQPPEIDSIRIERILNFRQKHTADVTITDKAQIRHFLEVLNSAEFRTPDEWDVVYDMDNPGLNYITVFSDGVLVAKYCHFSRFLGFGAEPEKRTIDSWPGMWLVMTNESTKAVEAVLDKLAPLDPPLDYSN